MQWDDLRFFLAVARFGSLTDAAQDLRSSPATVGRRIAALESKLGVRLFNRSQSGYFLNETGQNIRAKAEEVETSILDVQRAALKGDSRPSGTVRVATAVEIAANLFWPHLAGFTRRHPKIVLDVIGDISVANLSRREADVALRTVRPEASDLVVRRVGWWRCALYGSKQYVQDHDLRRGVRDFSNLSIITWSEKHEERRAAQWLEKNARTANVVLRANSRRLHYAACISGLGLAVLPCVIADQDKKLVQLLSPEEVYSSELFMVVHRDLASVARVRAVVDFFSPRILKFTGSLP